MMEREAVSRLIGRYLAALNAGDADAAADCVAPGFINEHTAGLGEGVCGRDAYRERLRVFLSEFVDRHYEVEDMLIDADRVAVPYVFSGRWLGTDGEYAPGRPFSLRGMFRFRMDDDGIAQRVDYWDSAEFMRQVNEGKTTS